MKVIKYYNEVTALPVDKLLRKYVLDRRLRLNVIVAGDNLPVNLTKVKVTATITDNDIALLTREVKAKYHTLDLESPDFLIDISADTETKDFAAILNDPTCVLTLVTPELIKKASEEELAAKTEGDIEKESKKVFFAVGRVNGPGDTVVDDYQKDDFRVRYDVNSRIEILLNDYKLTFTFRPQRLNNMGKLILPDQSMKVIREADFSLWLLGLYVLTNDYNEVRELMQELIDKYKIS